MTALLLLVLGPLGPFERALEEADALAKQARAAAEPAKAKAKAVDRALAAYDRVLALRPKDPKLAPRVRRRRASLLKHAGRTGAALDEYDRILEGRARRKDRARALYDGARLLHKSHRLADAETRLRRCLDEYRDVVRVRADAALLRGRVLEELGRLKEADRAYRFVVDKCKDQVKASIAAFDALALLALRRDDPNRAHRWLRACTARYAKPATRDDKFGRYVSRLLGEMKSPAELSRYED